MAVTNQELFNIFLANPNMSDAQIVSLMEQRGISPEQVSQTFGIPVGEIVSRAGAVIPPNEAKLLGDTWVQPNYQTVGSGENQQIGGLEGVSVYKTAGGVNDQLPVGSTIQNYSPTGEFTGTTKSQKTESGLREFALGAGLLFGLPTLLNAGAAGATGALGATEAATAFDLANAGIAGGTGNFTAAELAAIDAASIANTGGAGLLTNTGTGLTAGGTGLTTNTGLLTGGSDVVGMGGGTGLKVGTTGLDTITATNAGLNSGLTTGANTGLLTTTGTTLAGIDTGVTAANAAATAKAAADAATAKAAADAAAAAKLASQTGLITGALKTAGGLLQSEEDRAAAQLAAQNITKATQAGVESSQFRPVGMTTRFGTSNYTYDPVTGRMTSAGYQLSPEAKNAQDRLVGLAGRGLTQAEQAQQQFAPLQTAAQNLYSLGSQYIAKSPEEAAQDYINKQMQLLAPSRELDLANLQNRLFQQGRTGVSVAQGGTLGATTPELQALYNARAMQDLQLASQAQQEGRANTLFGSNLYDLGTAKLTNYYGGQQAAYAPYTTALGQIQGLETAAQQPLTMGANLAQQASTAGFNAGRLGLQGAGTAADISMGRAATTNPYASLLTGISDPQFAQGLAKTIWGA